MPEAPLYRCMTKGTDAAEGPPTRGVHWVTSRRGVLTVYRDRVELGDWTIPHASVREARAYAFPSLLGTGLVLELRTDERTYQFGINPWAKPLDHLPYAVTRLESELGLSAASAVSRGLVGAYFGFMAVRDARADRPGWAFAELAITGLLVAPLLAAVVRRLRRG